MGNQTRKAAMSVDELLSKTDFSTPWPARHCEQVGDRIETTLTDALFLLNQSRSPSGPTTGILTLAAGAAAAAAPTTVTRYPVFATESAIFWGFVRSGS